VRGRDKAREYCGMVSVLLGTKTLLQKHQRAEGGCLDPEPTLPCIRPLEAGRTQDLPANRLSDSTWCSGQSLSVAGVSPKSGVSKTQLNSLPL
jgi:hypothetical protein